MTETIIYIAAARYLGGYTELTVSEYTVKKHGSRWKKLEAEVSAYKAMKTTIKR